MRTVGEAPSSTLKALRIPGIHSVLLNVAAYMTAFYGLYTYLGPYLGEVLQLPMSFAGLAIAAYGLGFGAAAPLGRLVDRYGATAAACVTFAGLDARLPGLDGGCRTSAGTAGALSCLGRGQSSRLEPANASACRGRPGAAGCHHGAV